MAASKSAISKWSRVTARSFAPTPAHTLAGEVADEVSFIQLLRREVRRTERSGRPFLLALVSSDAFRIEGDAEMVRDIATSLLESTRETDCLGWYKAGATLGILLTEIGEADATKVSMLTQKISRALRQAASADQMRRLRLAVHLFPLQSYSGEEGGWEEEVYRDLYGAGGMGEPESIVKRVIDVMGSALALLLLAPLFAVLALIVKLTSPGPIFYCQKRVGKYGKLFNFYKFRSMYVNNDPGAHREYVTQLIDGAKHVQQPNGMYKLVNDPRVTRIGRFLRKSSLDEMPQFFNVLRGDMSLVGPRPPLPYEFERYHTWHRRRVLEIKPGLTGLWQVKGRSRTTFDEMVRMDLHYARTRSLWMDLKIILQTPAAMFSGTGAS
jgi:lipopolysaccharide/colanic/teichoic acid biosynthesis glycosyltransferase